MPRRIWASCMVATVVLTGSVTGVAAAHDGRAPDAAPRGDSVVGYGGNNNPNVENYFSLAMKSDADGSNSRGYFEFHGTTRPPDVLAADVRCLRVAGNLATAVGQIVYSRNSNDVDLVGRYMIVRLEDNGRPPRGGPFTDEIRNQLLPVGAPEPPCPPPTNIEPSRGLSFGDITITDAP